MCQLLESDGDRYDQELHEYIKDYYCLSSEDVSYFGYRYCAHSIKFEKIESSTELENYQNGLLRYLHLHNQIINARENHADESEDMNRNCSATIAGFRRFELTQDTNYPVVMDLNRKENLFTTLTKKISLEGVSNNSKPDNKRRKVGSKKSSSSENPVYKRSKKSKPKRRRLTVSSSESSCDKTS